MTAVQTAKNYRTVTPYLIVADVPRLLKFLADAFDATERVRVPRGDGSIMHAEVQLGDSIVMMGEPTGTVSAMPASIFLRVQDADAAYRKAIEAGGTSVSEPKDQPHADERYGGVKDPCGNLWWPSMPIDGH
jgi:uncharacterized glyoxalase superfamily protein PhnB